MDPLLALEATVTKIKGTKDSIIALARGFKAALDAAGVDRVKLTALSDSLAAHETEMADWVIANPLPTPPAPPVP